ncbi:MAG: ATP-binding protein [Bryobacteraceae bacterium]
MLNELAQVDEFKRLKAQFLASLNHEIRTPLSGVLGMTDLLLETPLDSEQKEYVESAKLCAENLLALLNATLEYSDLAAGGVVLAEMAFDLSPTLASAVSQFDARAAVKGLTLIFRADPNLPAVVMGDALRLRQVLLHLVENAIKFTERGEVQVHARMRSAKGDRFHLEVRVQDSGIGIPEEKLGAIFESFQQLDSGLSRSYPGLGLGLAISQKLVALMEGEVTVDSVPGQGSLFTVLVPLRFAPDDAEDNSPSDDAPQSRDSRTWRVLVVEDNPVAQRVVGHVLSRGFYEYRCVSSGAEAINTAAAEHFDLVLMDLQMPGMDGFEAARRLREIPAYAHTPVIALTANSTDDCRRACEQHGLQGFLSKPVESDQVLDTLARFLR